MKLSFIKANLSRGNVWDELHIYIYIDISHGEDDKKWRRVVIEASLPCNHKRESDCSSGCEEARVPRQLASAKSRP